MKRLILTLIRLYQKTSFFHGYIARVLFMTDKVCRFTPTCSEYSYKAIDTYGLGKGMWLSIRRIVRCHPWSKGGHDPLQ
ncbi:membrane protein insertion efficiency factor YidD [Candidatus Roizmanbacteria bacterium RIFOXYB2_FULL_38_10]|nr:MAG: membrane protein insertion efficiency factor YidD [Candidatus Roizmanbacteria bacterium RIFOXYB2_FULL_38_10]OGK70614.1 MAG: membrane protein insertion efficiency factor YidD [Candidatus Roizmanbacteria bacterium RIFOXYC1_FULL_38_14]OGK73036.1 MAG: membrane protein insertion efficiency factor YidD [Candidatus Roizmanbacteria bacterium RIFOXYC2_FULL_38_9]